MKEKGNRKLFSDEDIISKDVITELLTIMKTQNDRYGCLLKFISNKDVLICSFEHIIRKNGYYSRGIDKEIISKVDIEFFEILSKELNTGAYMPNPTRRVYINKPDGSKRPLGISCSRDKIVQQACMIALSYIYEPLFIENSHGFRPSKSCHTAMNYYKMHFASAKWIINIDLKGCFDNINHHKLLLILNKKINDKGFDILYWKMVKAGYVYKGTHYHLDKETPQGSILSPIFSNIYLHELDIFIKNLKLNFDKGIEKKKNKLYRKLDVKEARKRMIISRDQMDDSFKRLNFVRYVDDFIIGIDGSLNDAKEIGNKVTEFLKNILFFEIKRYTIKNFCKEGDKFLGFIILGWKTKSRKLIDTKKGKQLAFHRPKILIPIEEILDKLNSMGLVRKYNNDFRGTAYRKLVQHPLYNIVEYYNSLYRGIANYYSIAYDIHSLRNLNYILKVSCCLTIALKMKLKTISKVIKKFGKNLTIKENGSFIKFIKFDKNYKSYIKIVEPMNLDNIIKFFSYGLRSKLKNNAGCENCGSFEYLSLHHVNPIKNINTKLKTLDKIKIKVERQQILLCRECHNKVHNSL